ncbi:Cu(I)/Ag(I) efflux system membrane protein CusA/SilA [Candidatus Thermokryptus mobilis]|uniref:Cu(I)/Ag(I) efflux system membrane protein CusA/SilA n=1 Tax=Candidatus Thermokryptus mobilis TaxID=1643428 RepID=A0A0S4NBE7_9BACT|nr:efflux RND transporter permease subunit [Candidatus Thermokryptus mobilis]CUU08201.1 Cu(I)/Ag(I) efflux system membrane protein CusA/SilA [Candidatus Thermokryptus mobilis]
MLQRIIEWSVNNKFIVVITVIFAILAGIYSIQTIPIDAIPDLSDVQVIIYTQYPGQSPEIVEQQITYPLTTAMVSVPKSKVVRGYSFFGFSLVYVIFEDGTDLYWARSRVLEYLNYAMNKLPKGVVPALGPDATGVGWVYMYALVSDKRDLSELRSIQDWYLRYALTSVEGVSEVASIGGYVKNYRITIDPNKLLAYNIPLSQVVMAIKRSNNDVGGEVIEMGEMEYMIRGLGYIKTIEDIKKIPVGVSTSSEKMAKVMTQAPMAEMSGIGMGSANMGSEMLSSHEIVSRNRIFGAGTPIYLGDIATISIEPMMRRGIAELNGEGEVVGGIIVMRHGENALKVIEGVKRKLEELKSGLPDDVKIITVYDRSELIKRSIATLREKLIEESLIVALVCFLFLFHFTSGFVAIFTLPTAILISFIIMKIQGINANIMSLGGIAVAIGTMVDAAIIMIENAHKHLERDSGKKDHWKIILDASKEVGPSLFYSLLVITVSFLPVFALEAQEGRLFKPLAYTKTYSMAAAAILSITIVPILMGYLIRGKIPPEERNPINRFLMKIYHPVLHFALRFKWLVIVATVLILALTYIPYSKIGSEFMPPLWEGDLLYMPTTLPGISITKAREILQQTDKIIKQFPEVHHVFGKIGRAETATDPAGLDMIETTIMLKPEKEWRPGMTPEKLVKEMDKALQIPGLSNAWTMPIKTRIDMLSTGIRTPVGIKVAGPDLKTLEEIGKEIEAVIRKVPGTVSAYSERILGGNYVDFKIKREEAARYGLTVGDVQDVIMTAIGGMEITTTVEGLERYPVSIRYPRELRDNIENLKRILVPTPTGAQVPLTQLADIEIKKGPMVIRSEDTRPNVWIYVDFRDYDVGTYVRMAQQAVKENVKLPPGYTISWSGQFEYMERAKQKLYYIIPATLLLIFVIIYLNTKSVTKVLIVFLAVPFSLVGAIWLLYILGYNMSVAVWVGIIALAGLDAETGVVMLLYLDLAYEEWKRKGLLRTIDDLKEAIYHGAVKRVRPKAMTVFTIIAGLLPIMWSHGTGADVMKRIAAPMVGGVVTSFILELIVYPAIYLIWRSWSLRKEIKTEQMERE